VTYDILHDKKFHREGIFIKLKGKVYTVLLRLGTVDSENEEIDIWQPPAPNPDFIWNMAVKAVCIVFTHVSRINM